MFISIRWNIKYFYLLLPTIHQSQCMSLFASHLVNLVLWLNYSYHTQFLLFELNFDCTVISEN